MGEVNPIVCRICGRTAVHAQQCPEGERERKRLQDELIAEYEEEFGA